nr:hypothetical protein CFP56_72530 [Quercus suber]
MFAKSQHVRCSSHENVSVVLGRERHLRDTEPRKRPGAANMTSTGERLDCKAAEEVQVDILPGPDLMHDADGVHYARAGRVQSGSV